MMTALVWLQSVLKNLVFDPFAMLQHENNLLSANPLIEKCSFMPVFYVQCCLRILSSWNFIYCLGHPLNLECSCVCFFSSLIVEHATMFFNLSWNLAWNNINVRLSYYFVGVECAVLEKNTVFSEHPQAHFINNRSMEVLFFILKFSFTFVVFFLLYADNLSSRFRECKKQLLDLQCGWTLGYFQKR